MTESAKQQAPSHRRSVRDRPRAQDTGPKDCRGNEGDDRRDDARIAIHLTVARRYVCAKAYAATVKAQNIVKMIPTHSRMNPSPAANRATSQTMNARM